MFDERSDGFDRPAHAFVAGNIFAPLTGEHTAKTTAEFGRYIDQLFLAFNFRLPNLCIGRCEIGRCAHHRRFEAIFHELFLDALKVLRLKALKKSGIHLNPVNAQRRGQLDPPK